MSRNIKGTRKAKAKIPVYESKDGQTLRVDPDNDITRVDEEFYYTNEVKMMTLNGKQNRYRKLYLYGVQFDLTVYMRETDFKKLTN